jgi:hypothetical protein
MGLFSSLGYGEASDMLGVGDLPSLFSVLGFWM